MLYICNLYNTVHQLYLNLKKKLGNSLAVQQLGLRVIAAEVPGLIPGRGTKIPQAWPKKKKPRRKEPKLYPNMFVWEERKVWNLYNTKLLPLFFPEGWIKGREMMGPSAQLPCPGWHDPAHMVAVLWFKKQQQQKANKTREKGALRTIYSCPQILWVRTSRTSVKTQESGLPWWRSG